MAAFVCTRFVHVVRALCRRRESGNREYAGITVLYIEKSFFLNLSKYRGLNRLYLFPFFLLIFFFYIIGG